MELDKLYKLKTEVSKLKLFFTFLILLFIVLFSMLGLTIISFILSIFFFFRIYRVFLKFKKSPNFFKIESINELNISFYDSKQKLIIEDFIQNFIFYKKRNSMFEIEHANLEKNLVLVMEDNAMKLYDFVIKEDIEMKNPRKIGGFWEIIELIFMP